MNKKLLAATIVTPVFAWSIQASAISPLVAVPQHYPPQQSVTLTSQADSLALAAASSAVQTVAPPPLSQSVASPTTSEVTPETDVRSGDIVVTARKRSETVQNVPITIQAVSQEALIRTGSTSLLDLARVAPGINITRAPNEAQVGVTLRGLGTNAGVPSFDSSVSLFVDGVYAPRSREFSASMFDVQRIEVISGTQAALLGKNTSLGAVNIVTRKPGKTLAVDARASYEFELGTPVLAGGIDLPISNTLRVRVSGQSERNKGWIKNLATGTRVPRADNDSIRAVAVWEPRDGFDLTATAQHFIGRNRGSAIEFVQTDGVTPQLLAALAGFPGTIEDRLDRVTSLSTPSANAGGDQTERMRVDKYILTGNVSLGEHVLTSITGYSDYAERAHAELDYLPGDYGVQLVNEGGKQFTQELRLVSPTDRRLRYLIGGLYLNGTLDNQTSFIVNYPFEVAPGVPFAGAEETKFFQRTKTYSAFGQGSYDIIPGLEATVGLRFTNEKKSIDLARDVITPGFFSAVVFPPYPRAQFSRSEDNFDYSAGLSYKVTKDFLVFASYGKGTKGGGFAQSVTRLDQTEYGKETSRTVEAGVKISDPDRHWIFNLSAFTTNVDNFQVVSFTGVQFVVINTNLRSRGFELATYWYPVPEFRLFLNNTFADAKDRGNGNPIPLAPKWTGSGGFNLDTPILSGMHFRVDGSVDWRGKRYYQQNPNTSPPGNSFVTYNLSAAVATADDRYEVRLIGRNLTNANSIAFAFPTPFLPAGNQSATSERSRTIALQLGVRF